MIKKQIAERSESPSEARRPPKGGAEIFSSERAEVRGEPEREKISDTRQTKHQKKIARVVLFWSVLSSGTVISNKNSYKSIIFSLKG